MTIVVYYLCIVFLLYFINNGKIMLPKKTLLLTVLMATTLISLGSLFLMPLEVFASHSFEAGVSGDQIPDNTHVDLSGLTLPELGVVPLYDASPNFISGHFLYRAPCDTSNQNPVSYTPEPLVTAIAGHIDESEEMTHVEPIPLYFIGHASPPTDTTFQSCVYHAHIPDPLNGGSPRNTDVDLVNCFDDEVTFNPGDAVDMNVQRSLGTIEDFYEPDPLLPSCDLGPNPVFNLNDEDEDNDGLGHEG
jgi:hypothetical protein